MDIANKNIIAVISQSDYAEQAYQQARNILLENSLVEDVTLIHCLNHQKGAARAITVLAVSLNQNVSRETFRESILLSLVNDVAKSCFVLQVLQPAAFQENLPSTELSDYILQFISFNNCANVHYINCRTDLKHAEYRDFQSELEKQGIIISNNFSDATTPWLIYKENCCLIGSEICTISNSRSDYLLDLWPSVKAKSAGASVSAAASAASEGEVESKGKGETEVEIAQITRATYKITELFARLSCLNNLSTISKHEQSGQVLPYTHIKSDNKHLTRSFFQSLTVWQAASPVAIDLGAAPGGWTQFLLNKGYKVLAIDPEALKIPQQANLLHFQGFSDQFCQLLLQNQASNHLDFPLIDLLVNDMKLTPRQSLMLTAELSPFVKKNAFICLTLKLLNEPKIAKQLSSIKNCLADKFSDYKLVYFRQLACNRQEITAVLQKLV